MRIWLPVIRLIAVSFSLSLGYALCVLVLLRLCECLCEGSFVFLIHMPNGDAGNETKYLEEAVWPTLLVGLEKLMKAFKNHTPLVCLIRIAVRCLSLILIDESAGYSRDLRGPQDDPHPAPCTMT